MHLENTDTHTHTYNIYTHRWTTSSHHKAQYMERSLCRRYIIRPLLHRIVLRTQSPLFRLRPAKPHRNSYSHIVQIYTALLKYVSALAKWSAAHQNDTISHEIKDSLKKMILIYIELN